jgi:hypothetical protein
MRLRMNRSEAGRLGFAKTGHLLRASAILRCEAARERYERAPVFCGYCGRRLLYEERAKKFCNHSCASSFTNSRRSPPNKCESCGGLARVGVKYCEAPACQAARRHKRVRLEDCALDRTRKEFLIRTRGHRCESCRNETWNDQPIPLVLDHKDGDHQNNVDANLRLLCPNCDAQTPTYKGRNRGHGRYARRMRYQAGKSF